MSADPELLELCPDTVTLAAPGAIDVYTQSTPGASASYAAHVEGKIQMVRDLNGRERVSTITVYILQWIAGLNPNWTIVLPARYSPLSPPIIAVETNADEVGAHHTVIYA